MGKLIAFQGMTTQPSLAALVTAFFFGAELAVDDKSPNTIRSYKADLTSFLAFFGSEVHQVNPFVLRPYFLSFEGRAPATRVWHRASIKAFCRWL